MSAELCRTCDQPTGRAGASEDSLFTDEGDGPYCEDCWAALPPTPTRPDAEES